jgi:VWFA-related protein
MAGEDAKYARSKMSSHSSGKAYNCSTSNPCNQNPIHGRHSLQGDSDMSAKSAWGFLLAACCQVGAVAQAPSTDTQAAADRVRLDIVVSDKAGKPISGLKPEDFKLMDNRQPATIRSFSAHEPGDGSAASLFIVVDNLNASFDAATSELLQIGSYLEKTGKMAFPVAVFLLTASGIEQMTPLSTNGGELADTLRHKKADAGQARLATGYYAAEERLETSLKSFSQLISGLGSIDGRKVVVWLGPGWPVIDSGEAQIGPVQQQFFFSTAIDLSRMLREERITIHSVNMVGASGRELFWESFTKPLIKQSKAEPGYVALQVFALHSGGTVVLGSNDIAKEIARCAQDAAAWYSLTFDSQKGNAPNTWHDVDVKIDEPQVKVRTENGYYAQP